jgi:hypothetical protein
MVTTRALLDIDFALRTRRRVLLFPLLVRPLFLVRLHELLDGLFAVHPLHRFSLLGGSF